MEHTSKEFVNELGNTIRIEIREEDIKGVPGILISIAGPDSDTDIHITRAEAECLYEQLGFLV